MYPRLTDINVQLAASTLAKPMEPTLKASFMCITWTPSHEQGEAHGRSIRNGT